MENNFQDLQNKTDEELLLALAEGEARALDVLFLRHSGKVLSYSKKRGLSLSQAEDVVQIVFLQLFRKKHLYDSSHKALAWIYVITKSELRDYLKKERQGNFEEFQDEMSQNAGTSPRSADEVLGTRDEASSKLSTLPARDQEVLELRYLDELEYDEIAQRLKLNETSIRQIVSRALKKLKTPHPQGGKK
jgi:RNA polymerase sigma-70 factor (ECF subfamily)